MHVSFTSHVAFLSSFLEDTFHQYEGIKPWRRTHGTEHRRKIKGISRMMVLKKPRLTFVEQVHRASGPRQNKRRGGFRRDRSFGREEWTYGFSDVFDYPGRSFITVRQAWIGDEYRENTKIIRMINSKKNKNLTRKKIWPKCITFLMCERYLYNYKKTKY